MAWYLVIGEAVMRGYAAWYPFPAVRMDERNLAYRYDEQLGWFPREDSDAPFVGVSGIRIHVHHNHLGFRDRDHGRKVLPRIAFVGDSFVWGYDVEAKQRFTEVLQEKVPSHEILNWGVSGYGTDQEYLVTRRFFDVFRPDMVFLLYCQNDPFDNTHSVQYGGYYKPYFLLNDKGLELRGVPVPRSANFFYARHAFLAQNSFLFRALVSVWSGAINPRPVTVADPTAALVLELKRYVESKGAELVLGFIDMSDALRKLADRNGIQYLDLRTNERTETGHWSVSGNQQVAERIYRFLRQQRGGGQVAASTR